MRRRSPLCAVLTALLIALVSHNRADAGPPFLTDDPEPTETGHWEIYAPALDIAGKGHDYEGSFGSELNYGVAPDVQLTVGLPAGYAHDAAGLNTGRGDLKLSVKFRFFHNDAAGLSVATFPGITLPTGSRGLSAGNVTALLPIWAQKDEGRWSLFGGGGYAVNPGHGNRDYWTGGVAVSRRVTDRLLLGVEVTRRGSDTVEGHASTSLGLGGILQLRAPFRLLGSAGPTYVDGEGSPGFHAFVALGLDL